MTANMRCTPSTTRTVGFFLLMCIISFVTSFSPSQMTNRFSTSFSTTLSNSYGTSPTTTTISTTSLYMANDPKGPGNGGNGDDFDTLKGGDTYEGDIDWDAEWKKVVAEKGTSSTSRPGKDFYKNDVEKAVAKTSRAVQEKIPKVKVEIPSVRSLQGDTKFWFGILALISVGTALISASASQSVYSNDSFYI